MHRIDVHRMIRRRAKDAGLDGDVCCHTFRATGLTAYLRNGGKLEHEHKWPCIRAPRQPSFTIAPVMSSRSMRSSAS